MYCRNCGTEAGPGQKFCRQCGTELQQPVEPTPAKPQQGEPKKKKPHAAIIALAGIVIVAAVGAVAWGAAGGFASDQQTEKQAGLGQEQDSSQVDDAATTGTQDGALDANAARYAAYLQKVEDYQSTYGQGVAQAVGDEDMEQITGLCLVDLIDFDNDGDEELLLGYYDESQADPYASDMFADPEAYHAEVWGYEDGKIAKLHDSELEATKRGFAYLPLYKRGDDVAMHAPDYSTDSENRHVEGDSMWILRSDSFEQDTVFGIHIPDNGDVAYEIDGKEVDADAFKKYYDKALDSQTATSYWMVWDDSSNIETGKWDTCNTPAHTLVTTNDTIAKLRGEEGTAAESQQASNSGVFAEKVRELVDTYGTPKIATYEEKHSGEEEYGYSDVVQAEGLSYAKLVDFDKDGADELLTICYDPTLLEDGYKHEQMGPEENMYRVDIWCATDEGVVSVNTSTLFPYGAGIGTYLYETDEYCALQTCQYDIRENDETFSLVTCAAGRAKNLTEWGRGDAYYSLDPEHQIEGKSVKESTYRNHLADFLGSFEVTMIRPFANAAWQEPDTRWDLFARASRYRIIEPGQAVETAKSTIEEIESAAG